MKPHPQSSTPPDLHAFKTPRLQDFSSTTPGLQDSKTPVLLLLAIAVVLRVVLLAKAPAIGYVWDFYYEGVRILFEQGRLPVAADCWQCYHPPLFYIAGWPFYALGQWLNPANPDLSLRLLTGLALLSTTVVTWYGYRLLRLCGASGVTLVMGIAVILASPLLFISAGGAEADILLTAILSAFLFYLTRVFVDPTYATTRQLVLIGALAGLAAATKYSGLLAILTAGLVIGVRLLTESTRGRVVRDGLLILLVATAIGGWKYGDNLRQHRTPFHANGSASEGLTFGARENRGGYEFLTLRLGDVRRLVGPRPPAGALTTFPVYRSVLTSLHAQAWSDMSFFSVPTRHGSGERLYPRRLIPVNLTMTVIVLGFVPELLAILGIWVSIRERVFWPIGLFSIATIAAYVAWFLPQESWALKTKYILCLLPPMVAYAMSGQGWLTRRVPWLGMVTLALLAALVASAHVYLYAFAFGRM